MEMVVNHTSETSKDRSVGVGRKYSNQPSSSLPLETKRDPRSVFVVVELVDGFVSQTVDDNPLVTVVLVRS